MARDAEGKLDQAKRLRKLAKDMQLSNPEAARNLRKIAARKENTAVKQFETRPRPKGRRTVRS